MLSRKNYKETIRKQTPTKQHYTIKKLTVGVASVLIGLSFMGELEGDSVHADTMTAGSESTSVTSTTAQDGLKKSPQLYLQVTDTNNPSTPSSASSTGTIKNVTSSAAVQVKSASDEEDSDSTLAKGENKFAQSAVKDSVTDGKTSTAEINPAKLSSPALITQLNQSLAKSSTSDALKANDELEIKATDPTNYPNCGDVDGPLFELDSGQLVNKYEVISLKDMYIFQILKLVNTKDSDFQYVILTMNRKDTADRSIYLFGTGSNYSDATVFKAKPNDTYELGKSGYSFTYTEPTTINGHDVDGSSYVTGSTYYDGWYLKPQHLQIIYSLGNYNPSNTDATSVGEIMPSYEKVPVIKYSGVPSNIISQPKVYIVGFTGQEFNVTDIINNYKKVLKGYYLQNPNVASMGTLSQFENGGYYLKTYYDNGNVDFKGLYHQIDDQGTMEVSVLNANNEIIAGPEIIPAGGSYEFKYYNWTARNPYVTSSAHEVTLKYAKLGSVIPVDENGNKINDGWQYVNDPDDASKATSPYEKAPVIDGYVAVSPDETIVLPHNLSSNTKIYYRKSIKVTYSGSDSKTYDGNPANFDPTTVKWSGLAGLNTSTLTSADFTWNTTDQKAPTAAGKYTLSLNPTGEAALRKANPNYDLKTISGSYTYTITPKMITEAQDVTYDGSYTKTYDGQAASVADIKDPTWTVKGLVNSDKYDHSGLTNEDFNWMKDGQPISGPEAGVGKYVLTLNQHGLDKLNQQNPNYQVDESALSGQYTYTINPLGIDKVTYSGSDSKTYDGNPANFDPTTVKWSGLAGLNTSTLTSADFTWNTTDQKAPTAAGKYTLSLNPTGEAALRKANPNYDLKTISGSYTYTITPKMITEAQDVTYDGSYTKTYDGQAASVADIKDPTWTVKGLVNSDKYDHSGLTNEDFNWMKDGQPISGPEAGVGKYVLTLNQHGLDKLNQQNPNYQVDESALSGQYTYTINPLGIDKVTYSGSDSKTYDGNPANFDPTTVKWSGLAGLNTSTLTSADFTWNTTDQKAPTAAGKYTLSLNPTGEAALRKANPNYDLKTISGSYTYTITPKMITEAQDVTYDGSYTKTYDGQAASVADIKDPTWTVKGLVNSDKYDHSGLTNEDFNWMKDGQPISGPEAGVGKYVLTLNQHGLDKLNQQNPNYQVDESALSGQYTYTINPLGIDKVTYSGSDSKTYDGNPANFDPTTVKWSGLAGLNTSTLTSADFTWNTTDQKAPTAAGKYTLSLNPTGEAALRKANPNYDLKTISGSYTYTITPKMITEAQDVTYDGSYTKTYDGQAASVADIKDPTWTVKGLVNSDKYDHSGLTNEDFNWMKDGQPISGPEAGVGKYVLTLNQHGLDKLNQQNPNYQVDESALSGQYTYTINPLGIDKVTYSGSDSKTYDGNPANFDPTTVKWSGLAGLNTSTLTSADFTWNTTDQKAPTAAGKYTLSLNPTGEAALRKANPNYDLKTISGSYTYTITPKMITEAQDVTYDGSYTKTYDGQAASVADIKDPTWTVKGLVNSDKYDHSGLTNEDFNWMKDGQPISGPEAGVGKYVLTLNQHGLDKLNQQNPNYQVDESALSGQYTYTINPLGIDKVTYSGSDSKTYDGNPANFDPTTVKWSGLAGLNTSTLTSADFTWNTTDQKAPTAAGKYTLSLNPTGEAALRKANPNYDLKTISGSYTYTITPKMITEAQDVTYDGSYTKTYDGQAASVADIKDPTWTVKGLVNSDKYDHSGLTNEDFNWMKDGQPISGPEAGVGKYVLTLNQHGLDKLNQQNPNYQVDESALSGQYTYTINPLGIDKVTYSGSDSKTYDGNPANFDPTTVKWSGLAGLNTSTLTSADFTWNTTDQKAPTAAGKYTLSLNPTGEAALRKANPNYDLKTISGSYTYTITPKMITEAQDVTYDGSYTKTYDGQAASVADIKDPTWTVKGLVNSDKYDHSGLTNEDFNWMKDGQPISGPEAGVGKYVLTLNQHGLDKLNQQNPNYQVDESALSGQYTYTINPLGIDKVTYSGSDSKTYDGNPANFDPTTVKWSGLAGLNTSTLTSADFTWNTTDQKAPTAAGKYTLSLNPTGEAALRKANPNYDLKTISGSYTYTITPKMITEAQDVTYDGSYTKTYDGQAASVADIKDPTWTVKGLVNSDKYDHSGLTNEDFNWMKDGQPISGPEAGVGKYVLTLNQHGLDKLNQQNPNYQVDESALSGQYTYTINPLGIDKVTYSGSDSKTYDGNPANFDPTTVKWSGLAGLNTSTLTSADFTWNTTDQKAPTAAGKYTLSLNPTGEAALRKANPNYDLKTISGSYTYTITPKMITEAQDVTYDGSYTKTYDGQAASVADIKDPTWTVKGLVNSDKYDHSGLTNEDFNWMKDGQPISGPEAGVGKYVLTLNQHGLDKLNQQNPNYQVDESALSGQYTYTINPLGIDKVTYSGSDSKTYDGNPANFDPTTVKWSGLAGLNTSTLTSADFTWNTTDQKAPTAAGKYTLSLNPTGEAALRKANPNYDLKTISGSYTYTITPKMITEAQDVTYDGSYTKTYDGQAASVADIKDPTWTVKGLVNSDKYDHSGLTNEDFNWMKDGQPISGPEAGVGKYVLTLNQHGLDKLNQQNPNYQVDESALSGQYTYTINPLGIDKVTYSGSDSKTYDGNPANFDPTTVKWSGLAGLNTSTLTSADFTWNTTDQKAPTAAGKYTLSLNPTGEAALRKANPNYDLKTISGSYTYTITPKMITEAQDVTYDGSYTKTYDGQAASVADIKDPTWTVKGLVNSDKYDHSGLTNEDFNWMKDGQPISGPEAGVGKYVLTLNQHGLDKLNQQNPNYQVDESALSGQYTYTINPLGIDKVTYSGSDSKTYDGNPANFDPTTVKWSGLAGLNTSTLTSADFTWNTTDQKAPTAAGKYTLSLNPTGEAALRKANPNYDLKTISGSYTYTITPKMITEAQDVTYDGSYTKTYDGQAASVADIKDPTWTVKGLVNSDKYDHSGLTNEDFNWMKDGQPISGPEAGVGKYVLTLNQHGLDKLNQQNPNYQVDESALSGQYTYTINPLGIDKVTYSGSDSKTYDGNPANFDPTTVKWSGLAGLNTSTLTSADFTWNTTDQKAPTAAGKYTLSLNPTGEAALRKANPNYDLKTISGSYTYTITPKMITEAQDVTYDGSYTKTYDGQAASVADIKDPTWTVKGLVNSDKYDHSGLTNEDFNWMKDGQPISGPEAGVGKYVLTLNQHGLDKLNQQNPNYQVDESALSGQYTYTINPLGIDKVTYSGSDSKTYDGNPANFDPTTVKWSGLAGLNTSTLTSADFTWNTTDQKAPTAAGKYTLSLNPTGEAALRKANPNYDLKTISGSYTYTITPKMITEAQDVTYDGSYTKTYDGQAASVADIKDPTWTVKGLVNSDKYDHSGLTNEDFNWMKDGQPISGPEAGVGKYVLTLNQHGLDKLNQQNPNYQVDESALSGQYTYTINPLGIDKVTYSGSDSKTYDGNPANFDPTTVKWSGLAGLNTSTLTSADFTWNTTDQKAPTAAGKYTLSLNPTGEAALRKANPNYDLKTISGSYTYTITPKMITEAQDVTYDGSYTKTYDGQAASVADIKDPTWTVKGLVNSDKYDHSGLTNEDFNWMKDGQPISGPEAGVGKYVLTLNQHGLDKLNQQNPNYQVDESALSGQYTYTINPLGIDKVTYSGSDSKTYDGNPANFDPTTVKWSGLAGLNTSTLTSADFTWNTTDQKAPTAAGKYTLSLNPTGEAALRKANPNYDLKTISGSYTYTITPKMITEAQDVTYDGSYTKTYDGQAASVADIKDPTWTVKGLVNSDKYDHSGLTNEDFNWMKDGQPISGPEAGVGKYVLTLNQHGLDKLNQQNPNYQVDESALSGQYTYTINPLGIDKVTYSGSDSKTYDGNPANFDPTTVKWSGLAGLNTSTLTSADFTWNTTDQKAPTAAGKYTLSLNPTGEAALRKANPNYDLKTISGSYTYTITPKMITEAQDVTYDGSYTKTYDGQAASVADIKDPTWTVKGLVNSDKYDHSGLTNEDFNWMKDGQPISGPEAGVGKYVLTLNQHGLDKLNQQNPNYQVDESALSGQYTYTINPLGIDKVTYSGSDSKTYDGQPGTINPAKLTWSKLPDGTSLKMPTWSAGDFAWDTADGLAPTAVGTYQIKLTDAGKAALKKANPNYDLSSITGVFTYEIKPAQTPETPGQTPEQQPGQTPEQQPDQNTNQSGTSENGFGPSARPNASTNSNASQLPQTGNDHSNTALAGLALASLTAMLGLGKKRKHD